MPCPIGGAPRRPARGDATGRHLAVFGFLSGWRCSGHAGGRDHERAWGYGKT
jgi:hypothetical protein